MTTTTVSIVFKGTGAGDVNVSFTGPKGFNMNFDIVKDFNQDYELDDGLYSININGTSGTTCTLTVSVGANALVTDPCPPVQIAINDGFNVPPLAPQ